MVAVSVSAPSIVTVTLPGCVQAMLSTVDPSRTSTVAVAVTVPFGAADVRREGQDVTVVATAYMVSLALRAAAALDERNVSVEIIDPRTLEPLDIETIVRSVRKTGRLIVVEYNTNQGNIYVPHPLDEFEFLALARLIGLHEAQIVAKIPSTFLGEFYAGLAFRIKATPKPA